MKKKYEAGGFRHVETTSLASGFIQLAPALGRPIPQKYLPLFFFAFLYTSRANNEVVDSFNLHLKVYTSSISLFFSLSFTAQMALCNLITSPCGLHLCNVLLLFHHQLIFNL